MIGGERTKQEKKKKKKKEQKKPPCLFISLETKKHKRNDAERQLSGRQKGRKKPQASSRTTPRPKIAGGTCLCRLLVLSRHGRQNRCWCLWVRGKPTACCSTKSQGSDLVQPI